MKRWILASALTGFFVAGTCGVSWATLIASADFNVDPSLEPSLAWIPLALGGMNVAGGIGSYDTVALLPAGASVGHSAPVGSFNGGNDMVSVVARMRVLAEDGFNGGSTSIDVIRNGWRWRMGIVSQNQPFHNAQFVHLNAANDTVFTAVPMDTSVFHNYALVVTDAINGFADLYVDSVLTIPNAPATLLGAGFDGRLEFGDTASTGAAMSEFDWVQVHNTVAVPEPATLGLLGLGGWLLLLRRRYMS